jgi:hypothetical protein
MLVTNHRQIESITRRLIALAKMSPHLADSIEANKLRCKLSKDTGSEKSRSFSIIITPLTINIRIITISGKRVRIIQYLLVISSSIIISNPSCSPISLRSICSKNLWCWWGRSHRRNWTRWTQDIAAKNTPETNSTHVNTHKGNDLSIISSIKNNWTTKEYDIA